ncbi:MAG: SDR family oxidoreductase [Planctomycetota bacterium]
MTRTTLVTGASGFLGPHVVAAAVARSRAEATLAEPLGPLVVAQCRSSALLAPRFSTPRDAAQWIEADLVDGLDALLERVAPTEIVHCAAMSRARECEKDPEGAGRVNADLPAAIARWAAERSCRFVHVSTDLVFGAEDAPAGGFDEDASPSPVSAYGRSKLAGERAALEAYPEATVVRLPLLYGDSAGRGCGASDALIEAVGRGERPPLFVDEWRTPLEVSNAAEALVEVLDFDAPGIVHVAGPERLSRYDLGLAVLRAMGLDAAAARAEVTEGRQADVDAGAPRPRDVSLSAAKARAALETELLGVEAGLARAL